MFRLIVRILCFTKILPTYNDAKLYRECILIACRIIIAYFLKKKIGVVHCLLIVFQDLLFSWLRTENLSTWLKLIKKQKFFLFLSWLFFILEIVAAFLMNFSLEATRDTLRVRNEKLTWKPDLKRKLTQRVEKIDELLGAIGKALLISANNDISNIKKICRYLTSLNKCGYNTIVVLMSSLKAKINRNKKQWKLNITKSWKI